MKSELESTKVINTQDIKEELEKQELGQVKQEQVEQKVLDGEKQQNEQIDSLDKKMEKLNNGQKDVLRQKIMAIYSKNKLNKTLTYDEKDNLDALYHDYKAIDGNSYIDKIYNRINKWKVLDDDYIED